MSESSSPDDCHQTREATAEQSASTSITTTDAADSVSNNAVERNVILTPPQSNTTASLGNPADGTDFESNSGAGELDVRSDQAASCTSEYCIPEAPCVSCESDSIAGEGWTTLQD